MQQVDSGGTFHYVCDGTSPASAVLKDGSAVYTPGLSERRGTTSKFYHSDALGSTRGITNSSQTVTDAVLYDAFGMTVSRTGTTPTPFGFVASGQYQTDNDSGLMLLGHRYYDASVGRFISSDPAKAGDNWYAYCDNNPLNKTDSTGEDGKESFTNFVKFTLYLAQLLSPFSKVDVGWTSTGGGRVEPDPGQNAKPPVETPQPGNSSGPGPKPKLPEPSDWWKRMFSTKAAAEIFEGLLGPVERVLPIFWIKTDPSKVFGKPGNNNSDA